MFDGKAAEAMQFYTSLFDNSAVKNITWYGPGESGPEGMVKHAIFSLNGQDYMCIDSAIKHEFTFTPSMSFYVNAGSEQEIDHLFALLSEGGAVLMPLGPYPFSPKFAWLSDRYGVSWQLNLTNE